MPEAKETGQAKAKGTAGQSSKEEVLKPFEEAHHDFFEATQAAWTAEEYQKRSTDAFLDYVRALQEAGDDQFKSYEAYFRYARAQHEALVPDEARQRFDDAFGDYVRKVKEAWANLNVNTLDPTSLANVSHAVLSVALHANQNPTKRT